LGAGAVAGYDDNIHFELRESECGKEHRYNPVDCHGGVIVECRHHGTGAGHGRSGFRRARQGPVDRGVQGDSFRGASGGGSPLACAEAGRAWQGIKKADQFGNSCIQNIVTERKPHTYEFMAHNAISEDCLYINVWTAARTPSERRPVYMYIYGGGNTEGSSAVPVYDGEGPAKKGIVLVTVSYRLGVLGFFTHPELTKEVEYHASGNYGVLDLVAALHWVHDNIAAFGGDPAKVTIGGQSAGAGNSHTLTASPLAKGLFRGAIAESGSSVSSGTSGSTLAAQEQVGVKFAHAKGAASLADLRKMSWQKLIEPTPGPTTGTGPYATAFRFSFHRQV
jgi:carboxylesterase type B